MRTGISVTRDHGRLHAIVELHGELCEATADRLRSELDQLVDDGIADITVDLRHLRMCTSHGLDVFDHSHHRVRDRHGGNLRICLDGAPRIVSCVVRLVSDQDPTFSPQIVEASAPSAVMEPCGRPRDGMS